MRKCILILLFIVSISPKVLSQNENWQILSFNSPLKTITFNSLGIGYIYGNGIRYKNTNGEFLPSFFNQNIGNISYVEDNWAYAIKKDSSNSSSIFITLTGGESWGEKSMPVYPNSHFNDIKFIDKNTGWVVGERNGFSLVLKTTNKGTSWTDQTTFNMYPEITCIHAFDSSNLLVAPFYLNENDNKLLKTSNGGQNWIPVQLSNVSRMKKILFINSQLGWIFTDNSKALKTTDGGINWFQSTLPKGFTFISAEFINNNTGIILGDSNNIAITTNGGNSWISKYVIPGLLSDTKINSVAFKSENEAWMCTDNGKLLKSTNVGFDWSIERDPIPQVSSGYAVSNDLIFVYQGNKFYKVTHNGKKFAHLLITTGNIKQIKIFGNNDIYILASKFYISTNGGSNWESMDIVAQNCMEFINAETGYIGGQGHWGQYLKTTNGGNSWVSYNLYKDSLPGNNAIVDMKFLNKDLGFAALVQGKILRTTNGGNNWEVKADVGSASFTTMDFSKNGSLFAASKHIHFNGNIWMSTTQIHKSIDLGENWNIIYEYYRTGFTPLSYSFKQIDFLDDKYGHAIFHGNDTTKFIKTTNGGNSFSTVPLGSSNTISSFSFDDNDGWLYGASGMIMTNTNMNVSITHNTLECPHSFSLSQNYPNPFNPSTKIKFDIPKGSLVKLKIYDMLGREVATLVNEKLNPGTYEYEWNGINLSSGVYFYKLEAENFIQTKRMVLVK